MDRSFQSSKSEDLFNMSAKERSALLFLVPIFLTLELKCEEVVCSLPHGIGQCCDDASGSFHFIRPGVDRNKRMSCKPELNEDKGIEQAYGDYERGDDAGLVPTVYISSYQSVDQEYESWDGQGNAEKIESAEGIEKSLVAFLHVFGRALEVALEHYR